MLEHFTLSNLMNKGCPIGKLFPPLSKYDERFIDTRARSKLTTRDLSSSAFKKNFLLNIVVTSVESYLRALRKEN